MGQYDTVFYLKINVGLSDLYFIAHDFVLYLLLFDALKFIFTDNSSVTQTLTSK